MDSKELELLIYLITSAQGLPGEPRIYGSIRLTEAASKLCQIILEKDPQNEGVRKLAERIDRDKGKALSREEDFFRMLEEASGLLVDCM